MGMTLLKLGGPTPLEPGEVLLHEQRRFRAVSSASYPSYRIGFNLPPLWKGVLLVTNRRCRVVASMFWVLTQEIGMWYPGQNPEGDTEIITGVSCRKGLFGRCLEIRSRNPRRRQRWLWSPDLTLRFFFKNPDQVEKVILEAMNQDGAANRSIRVTSR